EYLSWCQRSILVLAEHRRVSKKREVARGAAWSAGRMDTDAFHRGIRRQHITRGVLGLCALQADRGAGATEKHQSAYDLRFWLWVGQNHTVFPQRHRSIAGMGRRLLR